MRFFTAPMLNVETMFSFIKRRCKNRFDHGKQIDESIKHLFRTRYRLGMFDSPDLVSYSKIPETALESPEHKALSLQLAQQSMVLLKNSKNTLPLKKSIKKIAVIGPNADNGIAILGNYNGLPSKLTTVLEGIKNKLGSEVEVMYEKAINYTNDTLLCLTIK